MPPKHYWKTLYKSVNVKNSTVKFLMQTLQEMSLFQHILCPWFHFAVPTIAEVCPRWFHAPLEQGARTLLERLQTHILHTRTYTSAPSTVPPPASVSNINHNITGLTCVNYKPQRYKVTSYHKIPNYLLILIQPSLFI